MHCIKKARNEFERERTCQAKCGRAMWKVMEQEVEEPRMAENLWWIGGGKVMERWRGRMCEAPPGLTLPQGGVEAHKGGDSTAPSL